MKATKASEVAHKREDKNSAGEKNPEKKQPTVSKVLSPAVSRGDVIHPGVPPNVPRSELKTPVTELTQLENGIRVVSRELSSSGLSSTLGVVSSVGSRFERHPVQRGATTVLQLLSFGTPTRSYPDPTQFLIDLGGAAHICDTAREQSIHCIDLLRPYVDDAFPLLKEVLLNPQWEDEFVEQAKQTLMYQAEEAIPEAILGEALQLASFGSEQQLGQPHLYLDDNPALNARVISEFWKNRFIENPKEIVIAGAGIDHAHLVGLTQQHFGHLSQASNESTSSIETAEYRGGRVLVERPAKDDLVRIGLGFRVGGWHSDDLVALCVLQTLLGGGSSFSAGGPGKGMYSRLYRQILNKYSWVESAEAFAAFYTEVGLFGLSGSTTPEKANNLLYLFADHSKKLAKEPVTTEELNRAKNMLRGNVLTQLESRFVLFEDMGRQVLTYGHQEQVQKTCERINAVTQEDILDVARRAITSSPPFFAAVGDLSKASVVSHDEVSSWFS